MRLLALALVLLVPLAAAQTLVNPVKGEYNEVYIIAGRAIDALGRPATGATLLVELEQKGIRAEPLQAKTDCFGVFITYFELKEVKSDGKATLTLKGEQGGLDTRTTVTLDHFYRRSDVLMRYEGKWQSYCPDQTPLFGNRVSITGRILNRTEPYEVDGVKYDAKPEIEQVRLRYWDQPNHYVCPPSAEAPGNCDARAGLVDERGDFKYSWLFEKTFDVPADAKVEVLAGDKSWNFTVDPTYRVATALIEATGQGPTKLETPAAPLAALLALVGLAALASRPKRP